MTFLYIALALFALGVLVFIHELGHYFVAIWSKMTVETFSIGFGKPILKWKVKGVNWQVGWLPFGGYVKIKGMELQKKGKNEYVDPYTIENGFFSKSPLKRMAVAVAGPLANFILAFLIFCFIWVSGGRDKPFSEYTQYVGWVEPTSELYARGLRPGDLLESYDNEPFKNAKDLLYAAVFSGKSVNLKGKHVDWKSDTETPFNYTIAPFEAVGGIEGMKTTGIASTARYLIYDEQKGQASALFQESPMQGSGIINNDRLVWADGELLFSMEQISHLINQDYALLTVERDGKSFLSRQPRVLAQELMLSSRLKGDLIDWKYEAKIGGELEETRLLPYKITSSGVVQGEIPFIDAESRADFFALHPYSKTENPLQVNDKILAIDGVPFTTLPALLKQTQEHQVHLIVQENVLFGDKISWKNEDQTFHASFDSAAIGQIAQSIGTSEPIESAADLRLLKPVIPVSLGHFSLPEETKEALDQQIAQRRAQIMEIKDISKRNALLAAFEKEQNKRLLGIPLEDQQVDYNPGPIALFGAVFTETWQTLRALFIGNVHPKWLSGPVGIVRVIHHSWTIGINEALFWIAAISVNLGFLNLLPIPVLDGGYICLGFWELVTRRRIKPRTMERLIIPFVILLIGFLIFLTFQDVTRLF